MQILPENRRGGNIYNFIQLGRITFISKPGKVNTIRVNYRPISLMVKDIIILNQILTNIIQQYFKIITHQDQEGFIPGTQGWLNIWNSIHGIHYINRWKKKNHMTISIDAEKHLTKFNMHSWKKSQKTRNRAMKTDYKKPIVSVILKWWMT